MIYTFNFYTKDMSDLGVIATFNGLYEIIKNFNTAPINWIIPPQYDKQNGYHGFITRCSFNKVHNIQNEEVRNEMGSSTL